MLKGFKPRPNRTPRNQRLALWRRAVIRKLDELCNRCTLLEIDACEIEHKNRGDDHAFALDSLPD